MTPPANDDTSLDLNSPWWAEKMASVSEEQVQDALNHMGVEYRGGGQADPKEQPDLIGAAA